MDDESRGARRVTLARRAAAAVVVLAGVAWLLSGPQVCLDAVAGDGVRQLCRPPQATDATVLGWVVVVLGLLAPDVAELGVPGLFTLKRRLRSTEAALDEERAARESLEQRLSLFVETGDVTQAARQDTRVTVVNRIAAQTADLASGSTSAAVDFDAARRIAVAEAALRGLIGQIQDELGDDVAPHVYIPDNQGVLSPVLQDDALDMEAWPPTVGAVGTAYSSRSSVLVVGDAVTRGLPERQRRRYAPLHAVRAVPILRDGWVIGVLSASTATDPTPLVDADAEDVLTWSAAVAGEVLALLGWDRVGLPAEPDDGPPAAEERTLGS